VLSYLNATANLKVGKVIVSSRSAKLKTGNATFLKLIRRSLKISSIEIKPGGGSVLLRSPGSFSIITKKTKFFSFLKFPSKRIIRLSNFCYCTVGKISVIRYRFNSRKRAGLIRLAGFRPIVRGVAMNPIDHPHGGGVGKKSKKSVKMSP
jgi:large subunit ribosomal protein L2